VAIVLSILAINYFFLPPYYHFYIDQPLNVLQIGIFMFVGLVIVLITSNLVEKKNFEQLSQQLIQENAEQLRIALSAAQMGMWDWNMVTGEIKWSPEHALLFGLNPDDFDGRYETFDACVHPDDRPSLKEAIQQAFQTQSIYQHEFRVIWPDGSIHWLEGWGNGFYDQTGKALRMTGTIMNIDGRKQTETLLHHQFEEQRLLVEMKERIRQSLNLQDILQTTVEEVRGFLQCDRAPIFKIDSNYSGTVLVESVDPAWRAISSNHTYDPCIGKEYIEPFQQGLITAKSDIYTAEIAPCHLSMLASFQVRANLVVPILQGENLWGLLVIHHCAAPREWQTSEIELLRQLSAQASIAIQQADLLKQLQIVAVGCVASKNPSPKNQQIHSDAPLGEPSPNNPDVHSAQQLFGIET
jgi:PAS domain S-box-containing protein